MTLQFYLVRHGETDWNVQERVQGHYNTPLNQNGREQALKLAKDFQTIPFAICYSSDLDRAHETAKILTSIPISTDKRLRERDLASWEGKLYEELDNALPEEKQDVESHENIQVRALETLNEIAEKHHSAEGPILIATHGGVIRNILIKLLALNCKANDITAPNTSVLVLTYANKEWTVQKMHGIKLP